MKNLSYVGSKYYSSTTTNMAHDTGDLFSHLFNDYLRADAVPVLVEGMGKNGVLKGTEKNGVVEDMGNKGVESMVGAAEEAGSKKETSGGSNEKYGACEIHVLHPSVGFDMSKDTGTEWMARGAPPGSMKQRSLSRFRELASARMEDSRVLAFQVVGVAAPPQGMVNKRGAERMDGVPPAARGSKRQRSPSGWIETASGGSNDGGGSDVSREGMPKRVWVKDRGGKWWDTVSSPGYPDADFKRAFRMSRSTFEELCKMLAPTVEKVDTKMRAAIPVDKRVAVCVLRLSSGERLRPLSKRFGIGTTTSHTLVLEVSAAIRDIVLPQVVLWPDAITAATVATKFQALTGGIPDVIGAVCTTHIPIIAPKDDVANYYNAGLTERNRKTSYSVRLQASVDADGAFTGVCAGYPGAVPDEDVLLMSWLKTRTGDMLDQGKRLVGGVGYPLMDWMLVPYSHKNLTPTQHEFNGKVAAARAVAMDAFQRLKRRWACLQKRTEVKVTELPAILSACCALHNLCESRGDELDPELPSFELVDDEVVAPNPVRSATAALGRDSMANSLIY